MCLFSNGIIQDPYLNDNDVQLQWVALEDWTFSKKFHGPPDKYNAAHMLLPYIDTRATVTLNGVSVDYSMDNMFRSHRIDVKSYLNYDNGAENELKVGTAS